MDIYTRAKSLITRAEIAFEARDYFQANRYARESLGLVDSSDAHLVRGNVYLRLEATSIARKEYVKGINAKVNFYEVNRERCFEGLENLSIVS